MTRQVIPAVVLLSACAAPACVLAMITAAQTSHRSVIQSVSQGEKIFAQSCYSCHEAHSQNQLIGPGLKGYYSNHRPSPNDGVTREVITRGKRSNVDMQTITLRTELKVRSFRPKTKPRGYSRTKSMVDHPGSIENCADHCDWEANAESKNKAFDPVHSCAPPLFGRLMLVAGEPLDIGASSPPSSV